MSPRQKTAAYPDNPPSEWVRKWRRQPVRLPDGLLYFEYEVYASAQSRDRGDLPFLLNSHKATIREPHQRIVRPTPGFLSHVSGIDVPRLDLQEFFESDPRAYHYTGVDTDGKWLDRDNKLALAPFIFNTYWGKPEALDPQWLRETHILPQDGQVADLIAQYLAGVETRRLSGDHTGTTLDLQVGASNNDADERVSTGGVDITRTEVIVNQGTTDFYGGMRWVNSDIGLGNTIAVAYWRPYVADVAWDDPSLDIFFQKVAGPAVFTTTNSDISNRSLTTASVPWSTTGLGEGFTNSDSLVTPFQELIDAFAPTAIALVALAAGPNTQFRLDSYDVDTANAGFFHVEFSAGDVRRHIIPAYMRTNP